MCRQYIFVHPHSSTRLYMMLSSFSLELLLCIAEHLSLADLNSLVQTQKAFACLFTPLLYDQGLCAECDTPDNFGSRRDKPPSRSIFNYIGQWRSETILNYFRFKPGSVLKHGIPPGYVLLRMAAKAENTQLIEAYLSECKGSRRLIWALYGCVLYPVVRDRKESMAIWLVDKGADLSYSAKSSTCSILDMAARRCSAAVVQRIVDAAKDQLKTDQPLANDMLLWTKERHVLEYVIRRNNVKILRILLDNGVSPSPNFGSGRTALIEAAMEGKKNIVNILLDHGANPVFHWFELSALTAARWLRWKTLERILHAYTDAGGDINSDNPVIPPGCRQRPRYEGPTLLPLQHFARKGCVQGVKMLLEHNADPALIGGDREMIPLHHVLLLKRYKTKHDEVCRLLIDAAVRRGASLEQRSPSEHRVPANRGATALHLAVSRRRAKVVAMLLDNGADTLATNGAGKIPLDVAITRRHPAILDMMEKATPVES